MSLRWYVLENSDAEVKPVTAPRLHHFMAAEQEVTRGMSEYSDGHQVRLVPRLHRKITAPSIIANAQPRAANAIVSGIFQD
jgi:hypothetical protein